MKNFYVLDIQTNADGSCGVLSYGFENKGESEDKYLDTRKAARQSQVACHTILWVDKLGNTIEKKSYAHDEPVPNQTEGGEPTGNEGQSQ